MNCASAVTIPLAGALIGWFTNWLAVLLLFRPYRPVRIPLIGYSFQGMLPKYRFELARNIGFLIEKELLQVNELLEFFLSGETMGEIAQSIELTVRAKVMDGLPRWVPLSVKKTVADLLAEQLQKQIPALIEELKGRLGSRLKEKLRLAEIVESKLNEFSLNHLESIILSVASRELRHIEYLGGIIGFIIGLFQVGLLILID